MKIDFKNKIDMNKPMRNMLVTLATLFVLIIGYHFIANLFHSYQLAQDAKAPITVSTTKVSYQDWQPHLFSVGNLFAQDGIDVSAQVDGIISKIYVVSNQEVKQNDILIQLDASPDIAALESLKAEAELSRIIFERSREQFSFKAISQQELEENEYSMRTAQAEMAEQQALVDQKTIRAAFDGKIGISKLSPGQFIAAGDPMVTLQNLDTLYVYFYLPEQYFSQIKIGQDVVLRIDTYSDKTFAGKVSAVEPLINNSTHNIEVEATIENTNRELLPGMYAQIELITGTPEKHLTIPQSAISYNPYGNYVYIVLKDKKKLSVKQRFITVGETRGDQVTVLKGLKEGDEIVSSGQVKLKNEARININNEITSGSDKTPEAQDNE